MALFEAVRILIMFALAFVVALFITPIVVSILDRLDMRKRNIRSVEEAPVFNSFHSEKSETITMAGIIIWITVLGLAGFFFVFQKAFNGFGDYFNFVNRAETYLPIASLFFAAVLGLIDDVWGIKGKEIKTAGFSIIQKTLLFSVVSFAGAFWFYFRLGWDVVFVPFVGHFSIGPWYILVVVFVLLATALSSNETDGLDGLAGGVLFFAFVAMAVVSFALRRYDLAVMNAAILGALLAFLWFNIYPARFFMGDTGSMSLGITLGIMSLLTGTVFLLPFFAIVLVIESLSVIIQVSSKKFRGKRVFKSAPIHHHFQALGWHESQITMRFWILSAVFVVFGLVIYFLARFV